MASLATAINFSATTAQAEVLITREEAARPAAKPAPAPVITRGAITRAPEAILESPDLPGTAKSPVHLKVKLIAHNGAKVDLSTVRVLYLREPVVDLTQRLQPYLKPTGIDMPVAELPPGEHLISVELSDTAGHPSRPAAPFRIEIRP